MIEGMDFAYGVSVLLSWWLVGLNYIQGLVCNWHCDCEEWIQWGQCSLHCAVTARKGQKFTFLDLLCTNCISFLFLLPLSSFTSLFLDNASFDGNACVCDIRSHYRLDLQGEQFLCKMHMNRILIIFLEKKIKWLLFFPSCRYIAFFHFVSL